MKRTRVKICGLTRPEDALVAVASGADAIGLVFYAPSPRAVSLEQAKAITRVLPPFVTVVGLFVDAKQGVIEDALSELPLGLLQFHGDESPEECARYQQTYIKAVRMREGVDLAQIAEQYHHAAGLLLDSFQPGVPGGTGLTFDWSVIPVELNKPIVVAGGLSAANVHEAITRIHPYAVDVSGGVEEYKGIKSAEKIAAFMNEVARADEQVKRGQHC